MCVCDPSHHRAWGAETSFSPPPFSLSSSYYTTYNPLFLLPFSFSFPPSSPPKMGIAVLCSFTFFPPPLVEGSGKKKKKKIAVGSLTARKIAAIAPKFPHPLSPFGAEGKKGLDPEFFLAPLSSSSKTTTFGSDALSPSPLISRNKRVWGTVLGGAGRTRNEK